MSNKNIDPQIQEAIYTLYKNIRCLRLKAGLSIAQMAEIAGLSERALLDAENYASLECIYDIHLKNICVYFQVSADALMYEEFH